MNTTKSDRYELLLKQVTALLSGENNLIANMANTVAAIHETMGFWWTGYYLVEGQELVLGPFQGPVACTRIPYGKGVCGTAWQRSEMVIVPDVSLFPGHIACSSLSKSEIVVPVFLHNNDLSNNTNLLPSASTPLLPPASNPSPHAPNSSSPTSNPTLLTPHYSNLRQVCAVLDIDSRDLNTFDETDAHYLSVLAQLPFSQ